MWNGDYVYLLRLMVLKDFKIRYRNMSLGVLWSILNPLIMMMVLGFVFTRIFPGTIPHFFLYLLTGLIPYNFFSGAWGSGTVSVVDNAGLIKKVPVERTLTPIASVLSNLVHLGIQMLLLLLFLFVDGIRPNIHWLWLPILWVLELAVLIGLSLATSALYVIVRDLRYIVESLVQILFWLVPIFYSLDSVPADARGLYQYNPVTALVLAWRLILLHGQSPPMSLVLKLTLVAVVALAGGSMIFRRLRPRFYDYL